MPNKGTGRTQGAVCRDLLTPIPPVYVSRQSVCPDDEDVSVAACADELRCCDQAHHKAAAGCCQVKGDGLACTNACLYLRSVSTQLSLVKGYVHGLHASQRSGVACRVPRV